MGDYADIRQEMWREEFERALPYEEYLSASKPAHASKWRALEEKMGVPDECRELVASFARTINVLVYSGVWCGDCVRQGPMFQKLGALNEKIDVRFAERVDGSKLCDELRINGAMKVPVAVFLSEDFYEIGRFGDRLLTAYRKMAKQRLGDSCSTGLVAPPEEELAAEVREWCDIFERMHLILRLAPMLRQRYGD
jgi:thiol-disulfide isomerase/thioredoxin